MPQVQPRHSAHLFEGDLSPGGELVYVNDVIKGKLMESEKLRADMRDVLLEEGKPWEGLREKAAGAAPAP